MSLRSFVFVRTTGCVSSGICEGIGKDTSNSQRAGSALSEHRRLPGVQFIPIYLPIN